MFNCEIFQPERLKKLRMRILCDNITSGMNKNRSFKVRFYAGGHGSMHLESLYIINTALSKILYLKTFFHYVVQFHVMNIDQSDWKVYLDTVSCPTVHTQYTVQIKVSRLSKYRAQHCIHNILSKFTRCIRPNYCIRHLSANKFP